MGQDGYVVVDKKIGRLNENCNNIICPNFCCGNIALDDTIKTIADQAFQTSFSIKNIDFSNASNLESIGMSALSSMLNFDNLYIPNNCNKLLFIRDSAFAFNYFKSIKIDRTCSINFGAFESTNRLINLELNFLVFDDCANSWEENVFCESDAMPLETITLHHAVKGSTSAMDINELIPFNFGENCNFNNLKNIYFAGDITDEIITKYQQAEGWSDYADKISKKVSIS